MAEYLIQSESLVEVANEIRELSGTTEKLGLDAMATNVGAANDVIDSQSSLITQIASALEGKTGGNAEPVLQNKTVTPTTNQQIVTADNGYDGLDTVTVNAMPTATQATPSITVNSSGLITASATQTAGYVSAGTKSATKQLTVQAAQTITPGTSNKTISSGRYLTGTQTIKGDANLVADNIKSGVSIFGVTGTLTTGEDVTAETNAYTSHLTELESVIDSLPDAGSGDVEQEDLSVPIAEQDSLISQIQVALEGKTSHTVETATITYTTNSVDQNTVVLYQNTNGSQVYTGTSTTFECIVPSYIIVKHIRTINTNDPSCMEPKMILSSSSPYIYVFYVTESGTITFSNTTSGGGVA